MNVILFGATGMVGQGVLRECLLDPEVESVLSIGRGATGKVDLKLREILRDDLLDFSDLEADRSSEIKDVSVLAGRELSGKDACFFCLGISSAGMAEEDYRHVTYDITMAAATTLARLNPAMTFIFVSGAGTDSTERGRSMWARVKGETENALLKLPFKAAYMFRPAFIQPLHGITSRTKLYRAAYAVAIPLLPIFRALAPGAVTTTELVGRAMLKVARDGAPKRVLENDDINRLGRGEDLPKVTGADAP